ncbi:hypothetical protein GEMRC1_013737 [Eukaryota sp. GEM-RC1]
MFVVEQSSDSSLSYKLQKPLSPPPLDPFSPPPLDPSSPSGSQPVQVFEPLRNVLSAPVASPDQTVRVPAVESSQPTLKQLTLKSANERYSKSKLDQITAVYALSEGLPLSKVSSGTLLQNLLDSCVNHYKKYKSVFKLPSYTKLSDTVAPAVVEEIEGEVETRIESNSANGFALVVDGSEINQNSMINFCLVAANESLFFKAIEVNDDRKDEDFLTKMFNEVISQIGSHYVNLVITDGAPNYLNAAMNQSVKFKHIRGIRCAIHTLNCFLKDICTSESNNKIPSIVLLLQRATKVSNFVLDKPFVRKLMKKLGSPKKLKKIAMTRFYTHFVVIERLVELYTHINNTLTNPLYTAWLAKSQQRHLRSQSAEVKRIVADDDFWNQVREFIEFLRPLINLMLKLDSLTPIMGKLYRYLEVECLRIDTDRLFFFV